MNLVDQKCVPCEGGIDPMTKSDAEAMMDFHLKGWTLSNDAKFISKKYSFKDFARALAFVNKIGKIAENEGHHPDIELGWGRVKVTLTTHAIGGLSQNDFILAAKIDA
jgi:4a-hydroxytetrahydrobiopterin dehydratase